MGKSKRLFVLSKCFRRFEFCGVQKEKYNKVEEDTNGKAELKLVNQAPNSTSTRFSVYLTLQKSI
ncbi:unnamed protein product [Tenebrio molitor]|jgi:hypothetical protein|nr:unnamed protein product [Tenebrio molitor]